MSLRGHAALLLALVIWLPAVAHADTRAESKALYQQGMAHYQLDEWDAAIDSWEEGFRKSPTSEFLYNIAQAHRAAGHSDKALSFYRKFLRMAPSSPLRPSIEKRIVELEAKIADAPKAAPVPAPVVDVPAPAPAPVVVTQPEVTLTSAPPERDARPVYKKPWFWGVVGGGVVVVAAAITLGVVLGTRDSGRAPLPAVQLGLVGGAR